MRTDVLAYHDFYNTALGVRAASSIGERLSEAWGDATGLNVAAFGYGTPFLSLFPEARARFALAPAAQGVIAWPAEGPNTACLNRENAWPFPDASLDRVLLVHGLEEASSSRRLLREVWRTLCDDGRLIIVAPHRRGPWSVVDASPFAAGRPYSKGQLGRVLSSNLFRAEAWSSALHFPPIDKAWFLRLAPSWDRAGARVWPAFAGVLLVEATKELAVPAAPAQTVQVRAIRARLAGVQPARRAAPKGAPRTSKKIVDANTIDKERTPT